MSEVKQRSMTLVPPRMSLAEQWRQDWVVNAEEGTTIEDLKTPAYWSHVAANFNAYDRVEVREETGAWVADLMVTGAGRNWASVLVLAFHNLSGAPAAEIPVAKIAHKVKWRGPQHKWCVLRLSDNEVLQAGIDSEAAADLWLAQYERTVNAPG